MVHSISRKIINYNNDGFPFTLLMDLREKKEIKY